MTDTATAVPGETGGASPPGDPPRRRRSLLGRPPPSFVVTTPESLYLLVTSARGREALRTVETVIVDEIHAVARDKRGAHLALRLELPEGELEAVASAEQMADAVETIAGLVAQHRTTLVFVNTRRLAERLAHQLGERLGDDVVAAHHGSLSKERRYRVETRLRAGDLRALVATASLELGIDVGPVELVCQIGSPRSIATFLQRVGRANHHRTGVPQGVMYPTTRDELVECAALMAAVRTGRLDVIHLARLPLDILAQQVVAEVAAVGEEGWRLDEL